MMFASNLVKALIHCLMKPRLAGRKLKRRIQKKREISRNQEDRNRENIRRKQRRNRSGKTCGIYDR